jgi:hypothetical protein
MNYIETLFNIAPDGGNGLTELAILLVCLFLSLGAYRLHQTRKTELSRKS